MNSAMVFPLVVVMVPLRTSVADMMMSLGYDIHATKKRAKALFSLFNNYTNEVRKQDNLVPIIQFR